MTQRPAIAAAKPMRSRFSESGANLRSDSSERLTSKFLRASKALKTLALLQIMLGMPLSALAASPAVTPAEDRDYSQACGPDADAATFINDFDPTGFEGIKNLYRAFPLDDGGALAVGTNVKFAADEAGHGVILRQGPTGEAIWRLSFADGVSYPLSMFEMGDRDVVLVTESRLQRINRKGDIVWEGGLRSVDNERATIHAATTTTDGGIVIAGRGGSDGTDILAKWSAGGERLWQRNLPIDPSGEGRGAQAIAELDSGDLMVIGDRSHDGDKSRWGPAVIRTDSQGQIVFDRPIAFDQLAGATIWIEDAIAGPNDTTLVLGIVYSGRRGGEIFWKSEALLFRLDEQGRKIWERHRTIDDQTFGWSGTATISGQGTHSEEQISASWDIVLPNFNDAMRVRCRFAFPHDIGLQSTRTDAPSGARGGGAEPLARACHREAADRDDTTRPSDFPGVEMRDMNADPAIHACGIAMKADPTDPRLAFQMGRAYQVKTGDLDKDADEDVAGDYFRRAAGLYREAYDAGLAAAGAHLASLLKAGNGVDADATQARAILEEASKKGSLAATLGLGMMVMKGEAGPKDQDRGLQLLRKAADGGNEDAQHVLGYYHARGIVVERDYERAARYYRLSAEQGHPQSQYYLGVLLRSGRIGTERDIAGARKWLGAAADQGHEMAAEMLKVLQ